MDCSTDGCKMKQSIDTVTNLSMSISGAFTGEMVIAVEEDFDWNVTSSSIDGAFQ